MPPTRSEMADSKPTWRVEFDVYIARRRRVHQVQDASGAVVARFQHVEDVFDHLHINDVTQFLLVTREAAYMVDLEKRPW